MIGLSGPHRSGKSTLAKAFAEESGIKFVATGASATFERLGLDPKKDYPFEVRLAIQREILKDCNALYARAGVRFITDRTPIDFLAYTLADVSRENVRGSVETDLAQYVTECYESANTHFTTIVLVQPGIVVVEAVGKAPGSAGYMEHLNALMLGLLSAEALLSDQFAIPRRYVELEQRVLALGNAINKSSSRHLVKMDAMHENGLVLH
jgi:hypothetical protein